MGLDMYLYLRKYQSQYDKNGCSYPEELRTLEDWISERNFKSIYSEYQVGYWRKANAIHSWLVDNCADGVDECQEIYVDREKAEELLNLVQEVLKDHSKANELLHTQSGFFFGTTEYDEWYFHDLEYTEKLLTEILKPQYKNYSIIYNASW